MHGNPHLAEDLRDFVDEGDVDIALGVFDDLRRFGGADVLGDEDIAAVHCAVEAGEKLADLFVLTGDDLGDQVDPMNLVPRIDAFR